MSKLSTITDRKPVRRLKPMHPGEVLREEFMAPLELSAGKIAKAAGVPRTRIERIVREEIGITADTALRLGAVFGTTPEFWVNLQTRYDLLVAKNALAEELKRLRLMAAE
jgi:antitoxin HigA-1